MAKLLRYLLLVAIAAVLVALLIAWLKQTSQNQKPVGFSDFLVTVAASPESIHEVTISADKATATMAGDSVEIVTLGNSEVVKQLTDLLSQKHVKWKFDASSTLANQQWVTIIASIVPAVFI